MKEPPSDPITTPTFYRHIKNLFENNLQLIGKMITAQWL